MGTIRSELKDYRQYRRFQTPVSREFGIEIECETDGRQAYGTLLVQNDDTVEMDSPLRQSRNIEVSSIVILN